MSRAWSRCSSTSAAWRDGVRCCEGWIEALSNEQWPAAMSSAWHGHRSALARNCRRYNLMVCEGWLVLRFSYEDVMGDPASVRATLVEAVALAELLKEALDLRARAA